MFNVQRHPNPSPTPITSSNNAPNIMAEGESIQLTRFFTVKSTAIAFEERKRERQTSGSKIKCAKTGCVEMLETGPHCQFCIKCGANQQIEETKLLKATMEKIKN